MLPHTDRRTVLQTTGGVLVGTTILARPSAAQEESLEMTIRRARIDPERDDVIPVEVTFPPLPYAPDDFFMGPRRTFIVEGESVRIDPDRAEDVANPVSVREVSETRLIMISPTRTSATPNLISGTAQWGWACSPRKTTRSRSPNGTPILSASLTA